MSNKPIQYIDFQSNKNSENFKIKTDIKQTVSGSELNCVVSSIEGLFDTAENTSDPIQKSYSSGSVFDPSPIFSYKTITVEILFYAKNSSTLKNKYKSFYNFLKNNGSDLKIVTDFPHNYTAQFQRMQLERDAWNNKGGGFMIASAYFACKEAW